MASDSWAGKRSYFQAKPSSGPHLSGIIDSRQRVSILWAMAFIPPDSRSQFLQTLFQFNPLPNEPKEMLHEVFWINQDLASESHAFLIDQLENETDVEQARKRALFIYDNRYYLLILGEHPLAQAAIQTLTVTEDSQNGKGPYNLYKELKKLSQVETPQVDLPSAKIDEKTVTLDPEGFRKKLVEKPRATFKDLPKEVTPEDLSQLFQDFDTRFNGLSDEEKEKVESEVESRTGETLSKLKSNFAEDPFLQNCVSVHGKPDDTVPDTVLGFRMILKYIKDQEDELEEGALLTPREEILFNMSSSIQFCSTGKSEGIKLAYNLLPVEYRTVVVEKESESAKKGAVFVDQFIQMKLTDLLSSKNDLMKELTGEEKISQFSHQSLYLKNLIGRRIGLDHSLKFDKHTHLLYDRLIRRSLKNVLQIFYGHLTPDYLVKELIEAVNRELVKPGFTKKLFELTPQEKHGAMFDYDDDKETYTLTEAGAAVILEALGYVKEKTKQEEH